VDIGLLTNRRLARDGYRALPEVLREELPDAIEVHDIWAATPHIYGLAVFRDGYQAALVGSTRLYIRDPLVEPLLKHRTVRWCQVVEAKCREKALVTHRYVEHTTVADDAAFLRRGQILIIGD
jgi:hypothetical protein